MSENQNAVTVKLLSEGTDIGNPGIISLVVYSAVNAIGYAELYIDDGEIASREFKVSNDPNFAPGKKLSIEMGHGPATEPVFEGIVVRHKIRARMNGTSSLCLELKHAAVQMTQVRKSRHFIEKTDTDIVEALIGDHSDISPEVDGDMDLEHEKMIQYNVTDWDFMITRAEANGCVTYTEEDKVIVTAPKVVEADGLPITYGDNVWEFEAEAEARDQYSAGGGASWDYLGQEAEAGAAEDPSDVQESGNVDAATMADALGEGEYELRHPGALTETELINWSSGQLLRSRLSKIRGRIKVEGSQEYKIGATLTLDGFSDVFNGPVYLSGVRHEMAEGLWTTDLQIGIDPECYMALRPDVVEAPVAGLVPPMRGLQIGTVKEIEEDPQGQFRVLVKMPMVNDEEDGIWARVSHADAGAGHTLFFQPDIDDEVVVGFLGEDPRHAIVLGSLHNGDANKPAIEDNDEFLKKGIVTKEGLMLIFDDDLKSITLETPNGNKAVLDDDAGGILLEDENGNIFEMSSDGITMESAGDINIKATGDVNMEGVNLALAAQAQFTAEGSAGVEVSSSAVAVLKGSLVQIN